MKTRSIPGAFFKISFNKENSKNKQTKEDTFDDGKSS